MNGSELVVEIYGGAFNQDVVLAPEPEVEVIGLKPESGYSFHQWVEERKKMPVEEVFALEIESQQAAEEQGQLEEYLQGSYEQGVFEEEMKDVMPEPPAPVLSLTTFERWVEERKKMTPEEVEDEEVAIHIRAGEMPAQYVAGVWVESEEQARKRVEFFEEEGAISLEMDEGAFLDEMSSDLW